MSNDTQVGIIPVPPGKTANFDVDHITSIQAQYIIGYSITFAAATLALAIRLYTRIWIVHLPSYDDVATCLAWITTVISFIFAIAGMKQGFGKHIWEIMPKHYHKILTYIIPAAVSYGAASAFTKLSILIMLYRLNPNRWFRYTIIFLSITIVCYTAVLSSILSTTCSPLKPNTADCAASLGLAQAILNILTDVITIILPLPMIYFLKIKLREKIALAAVLSAGAGVVVISIVRITYVMGMQHNIDLIYAEFVTGIWSSCEINIGIICNCVVVIKPFLRKHVSFIFSTESRSGRLSGATRTRQYATFGDRGGDSFHLTSISNATHAEIARREAAVKGNGITVTNTYIVEAGTKGKRDPETESTEDIIGSPSTRSGYT